MKATARVQEYLRRIGVDEDADESPLDRGPPRKLYRASEVADHLGVTRQTLHNYVTIGLITEARQTVGGQRLFDESVFARLALIRRMKRSHRLHEIRGLLERGQAVAAVAHARRQTRDASGEPRTDPRLTSGASHGDSQGDDRSLERSRQIAAVAHAGRQPQAASGEPRTDPRLTSGAGHNSDPRLTSGAGHSEADSADTSSHPPVENPADAPNGT
jgi:DNA-binding transcriptional MerR regulator